MLKEHGGHGSPNSSEAAVQYEFCEARPQAWLIHPFAEKETWFVLRQRFRGSAFAVDYLIVTHGDTDVWVASQWRQQSFEKFGLGGIVAGRDVEVTPPGALQAFVPASVDPLTRHLMQSDPRIAGKLLEELPGAIVRMAVADDQFPVRESLRQDRFHALFQERASVQIRQADGNQRGFHSTMRKHSLHSERSERVESFDWSRCF